MNCFNLSYRIMTFSPYPHSPAASVINDLLSFAEDDSDTVMSPPATEFSGGGLVYLMQIMRMMIPQKVSFRLTNPLLGEQM